ncbi:PE-PGRS family protein [Mycobacterium senriense]
MASRPKDKASPDGLTPTRKLVKDIVDGGGLLEIDTTNDKTSYRGLVGIINRRGMAPDGQEVIMLCGKTYHHIVFRLSSVSNWQTKPPSEVVAVDRIGRWHPVVASLRGDKRLESIEKELRGRAFRLLHALAGEAEARGHSVRVPRQNYRGYEQENTKLSGDLIFKVGDIDCSVNIWQPKDRIDHTPTGEEVDRHKKYDWPPRRYDYVPSNRLSLTVDTTSRFSSKESWTETKTLSLQSRLPDVMMMFERWAVIDAEGKEAERRADIERREREAREEELARESYIQQALSERLKADLKEWELAGRLRRYLAEMTTRVEQIADSDDRAAATNWLIWCEDYTAKLDPFAKPIRRPKVKEPGYSEIEEFRKRRGFHHGFW